MDRRSGMREADPELEQTPPRADDDAWNTPEFRRSVLLDVAFVIAPAIFMVALGERAIAAAWFGIGILVVLVQFRRQIRSFLRSLRSQR